MDKHEFLKRATDYRDYRDRRHFLKHATADEVAAELEHKGFARIHGQENGGILVTHVHEDGSEEEHAFGPDQYPEACDHLHCLIRDDFTGQSENEEPSSSVSVPQQRP